MGYNVLGTDISEGAVKLAESEAKRLHAEAKFELNDMRIYNSNYKEKFEAVICCDNSLLHLKLPKKFYQP